MLVVGVTCTLASRSFLLFSPSCYVPAKFNVSISFAVVFLQPFESRLPFLSIGYRSSSSLSMSPRFRHCLSYSSPDPCSHPLNLLRIYGSPLDSRFYSSVSVSVICSVSRPHLFQRNLVFPQHHRYPYLSPSFFAFDIRCPCSPTCFFRS
jgi:hypothetical protein